MIAYSHIPKAGGTTLIHLLRSYFGVSHIDVIPRKNGESLHKVYRYDNLKKDVKVHPCVSSLSGHSLKPYEDFGEFSKELRWYTFVRDPLKRSYSQYNQDVQLGRCAPETTYYEWAKIPHLGERNRNAQVKQLSGHESAAAAIEMIHAKKMFVGVLEDFDFSLKVWREYFGLRSMSIEYGQAKNVRQASSTKKSGKNDSELESAIMSQNLEDMKFYDYIIGEYFPKMIEEWGGREYITNLSTRGEGGAVQETLNKLYRNSVYKPFVAFDQYIG